MQWIGLRWVRMGLMGLGRIGWMGLGWFLVGFGLNCVDWFEWALWVELVGLYFGRMRLYWFRLDLLV